MDRNSTMEVIKSAGGDADAWSRMTLDERREFAREQGNLVKSGGSGDEDTTDSETRIAALVLQEFANKMGKPMLAETRKALAQSQEASSRVKDLEKMVAQAMNPNSPSAFGSGGGGDGPSLGELLVKSEAWRQSAFAGLQPGDSMNNLQNAQVNAPVGSLIKAITSATAIPDRTRVAGILPAAPQWASWLFARVAQGQMTGGTLEYVQDTTAALDATVAPTVEGALKPEVAMTFELKTLTPKTIAHWIEASKQILADTAALQSYINAVLLHYVARKLEHQVINGTGLGTNMTGIMGVAPDAGAITVGDSPIDSIRRGIGVVEASGWVVDTVGLNPVDWASVQLTKGDDGHYVYSSPGLSGTGAQPLWSKVVVPTPAVAQGKYLVGAFAQGAQLFEREGAHVMVGFQGDNFVRNLVTLLAEGRFDLAIYATSAFRKGNLA